MPPNRSGEAKRILSFGSLGPRLHVQAAHA